jgi:hypothetical protein
LRQRHAAIARARRSSFSEAITQKPISKIPANKKIKNGILGYDTQNAQR